MMNLINTIGQRKFAKILFVIAFIIPLLGFFIQKGTIAFLVPQVWMAAVLFSAPNFLLAIAAHKSKEYRFFALLLSLSVIVINVSLFYIGIMEYLFAVSLIEIVFGIVFIIFVNHANKTRKVSEKALHTRMSRNKATKNLLKKEDSSKSE